MSTQQLAKYKQHLQQYVFAGWAPPDDLKEWGRMFERVAKSANLADKMEDDPCVFTPEDLQGTTECCCCVQSFVACCWL